MKYIVWILFVLLPAVFYLVVLFSGKNINIISQLALIFALFIYGSIAWLKI